MEFAKNIPKPTKKSVQFEEVEEIEEKESSPLRELQMKHEDLCKEYNIASKTNRKIIKRLSIIREKLFMC